MKMRTGRLAVFCFVVSSWGCWAGASEANALAARPTRGFTAVVGHRGDEVVVSDAEGCVVAEARAGEQDARLLQQAAELCRKGGELRIMAGEYDLKQPILLDFPCTVSGEGRGTILVPTTNDYAIRIMKTDRSPTLNDWVWGPERKTATPGLLKLCGERLYGVYVRSLAIVGNGRGKGIYLSGVTECICDDLAIHSTYDGAAIYADQTVMESEFRSIVCYVNGSIKNREGTIVVASQDGGDANNNLQFTRVHVLLPNYVGVQIGTGKPSPPRLIFFTQSFFHGWLPFERTAPYDLFLVHAADPERGIVISASRFTNAGKTNAMLHVQKGAVDLTDSILGGGTGNTVILADPNTRLSIRGNTFHHVMSGQWSLDATRADVIFAHNMLDPHGRIRMQDAATAVVTGNRFGCPEQEAIVLLPQSLSLTNDRIQMTGNVFAPVPKAPAGSW
jgi:hypothetical protein